MNIPKIHLSEIDIVVALAYIILLIPLIATIINEIL